MKYFLPLTDPILEMVDISVKLSGLQILDSVSIGVPQGTVTGLIGPNGAGKTTVFNVISGFVTADSGYLKVDGKKQKHVQPHHLTKKGIARTLQGVGLFPTMSALENVMIGGSSSVRSGIIAQALAMPWTDVEQNRLRAKSMAVLGELNIADAANRLPGELPYPIQKRVALARALVSYPQALSDLGTVLTTLGGVAAGTVTTSAVGYPVAQANMLAALMAGLPTKSTVYDGQTVNPAYATLGTLAAVVGGYSPASAGANTAAAMLQNVGGAAALGILGRYELEQRARTIASIPATTTANFNDNINVSYTNLLSSEQRGEFGDTLNASTVMPNLLNAMLAKLDASKGDATARFGANAAAVAAVRALPAAKGVYSVPTLLISTTYDPIVAAGNTSEFYAKLAKSGAKSTLLKIAQFYTVPSPDGYTKFAAGGKSPDAAASAAANTSGVGHCAFFGLEAGAQITNAVKTLNAMVNAKTASALKKAKAIQYATAGVNNDGQYEPDALKRPNAK